LETASFKHPIVNLSVLKDGNLRIGTLMSFILGFGLYGSTLIIPIYTQSILRWTATDAGLLLIPGSITTAIMMPFVGRMIQKGSAVVYGRSWILSFFIFTLMMHNVMTPDTGVEHMFWPLILRGVGLGLLCTYYPITFYLKRKKYWRRSSIYRNDATTRRIFGIAIITTFITRFTQNTE
jgi:DHA2 family multidrug resistance protein